jgi:hypothetical protein
MAAGAILAGPAQFTPVAAITVVIAIMTGGTAMSAAITIGVTVKGTTTGETAGAGTTKKVGPTLIETNHLVAIPTVTRGRITTRRIVQNGEK